MANEKRTITYFLPQKLTLNAKQIAKLEKAHKEIWGDDPGYKLTNYDLIAIAMKEGVIEEEDGWIAEEADGKLAV